MENYKEPIFNYYFSIIIPLYNKVDYIEKAIQSVLAQTYQNFEIIVVNDGSTDEGEKIVESFHNKKIILINQINQGVSVARNTGAQNSKYDFLAFLDADDIWHSEFLEQLNVLINKFPEMGIYGINNLFEYSNGKIHYEKYEKLFNGSESGIICDYFDIFSRKGNSPFSNSGLCIPKTIFQEVGGYKPYVRLTEDSDLWCRIALKYDIAFLKKPLVTYFIGTEGSTHFFIEKKDFQVATTLRQNLKAKRVKPQFVKSVKRLIAFQQLSLIKRSILANEKSFALQKILNASIWYFFPFEIFKCIISLFFPSSLIIRLRK